MIVKYTGTSNFQVFDKADFDKADLEQKKLTFERDVPQEVDDATGQALVAKDGIFGDFEFEQVEDEEPAPKAAKKATSKKTDAMTDSGTPQEVDGKTSTAGADTATAEGTAGNGASTKGSPR